MVYTTTSLSNHSEAAYAKALVDWKSELQYIVGFA